MFREKTVLFWRQIKLCVAICFIGSTLGAAQSGDFTYTDNGADITIWGYAGAGGAVTIPDSIIGKPVTNIATSAFGYCGSLTSVTIPNSVTSIGDYAFQGCSGLTSVTIGSGVTSIGYDVFSGCPNLTMISVSLDNLNYSSDSGGVLFNKGKTVLIQCPEGKSGAYTIPTSVTSIGDEAFANCSNLTMILVTPSNLNYSSDSGGVLFNKGKTVLIQCPGGKSGAYTIPNNVISIGDEAFAACFYLTSVIIPNSVTSIGESAFAVSGLTTVTIGSGVTSIGNYVFNSCELTSVTIPNSVTSIGDYAFQSCSSLTSVTIGSGVTSIGDSAFSECNSLESITIGSGVTSIGNDAFSCCNELTSITISNGVTSIGDRAFLGCWSLISINIPNSVINIGYGAFNSCSSLTSITIPNSVTSIGDDAFMDCYGLTNATIGNGVTSIGYCTFYGCSSLTSIIIPNSVTSIGDYVFSDCSNLNGAYFLGDAPTMGSAVFDSCASGFTVYFFEGAKGFTLPTWEGYPSATISTSISGTVSGAVLQGVTLTLSGAASSTSMSGADGTFAFALSDGSYTVIPSLSGYTFKPSSKAITVSGTNVTGCDFTATKNPGIYSISGKISGAIKASVTITLSGALSLTTLSDADGLYSFTGLANGSYTVTPELLGYIFTPFSQDVTIASANKSDINFTATAISIYGTILKPSFNASHKEAVKKINGTNVEYSTDKFTVQTIIQFPDGFDLTTIGEDTGFTFNFGLYSFSDTLGNAKSKFNGAKGGSATFKITGKDEIKGKMMTVEKVDLRWDKKKKLTVKITGTPVSNSNINVVDLSGEITGNIDIFFLTFNDAGARFAEGESLAYIGKKTTKIVKTFTLVDWSAKGKK